MPVYHITITMQYHLHGSCFELGIEKVLGIKTHLSKNEVKYFFGIKETELILAHEMTLVDVPYSILRESMRREHFACAFPKTYTEAISLTPALHLNGITIFQKFPFCIPIERNFSCSFPA